MDCTKLTTESYLLYLHDKGFRFNDENIAFIYFGRSLTNASEAIVNLSIELTIMSKKTFDGSYYISILETLLDHRITNRKAGIKLAYDKGILVG
ncbi:hypothetical protein Q75_08305 [Bacillus coahuilensis p1.1.43]|uniref:Uncharacterized protein n=1 Tax=Bacillus coahuilensis p1.1.43 TaxID=1150625 RepID=A0A147K8Q7_9BACI|nr:DUF6123 family protein [Bacillus coahuilensis]KUP06517.1 hypothetical protein Q75_08305 [Bacillus coahuilensis p1.1.43]